jgi:hypothetical protein
MGGKPLLHNAGVSPEEAGRGAAGPDSLLQEVERLWPCGRARREVAGVPAEVFDVVTTGHLRGPLKRVAEELDRRSPGWPERLAEQVAGYPGDAMPTQLQRACLLLAARRLREPGDLLQALEAATGSPDRCFWLLAALAGTDTPGVRAGWLSSLQRLSRAGGGSRGATARPVWLAFLRALPGGWLTWEDFRRCLAGARMLDRVTGARGYRAALERARLWAHPAFAKRYRQLVYETAHQPDASLSFQESGWIRDFPGEGYLWDALEGLARQPDSWWHLYVLRWMSDVRPVDEAVLSGLAGAAPIALTLLSLVRSDFAHPVGFALGAPEHGAIVAWLKEAGPSAMPDAGWVETTFADWVQAMGEAFMQAVGALCSLSLPEDWLPDDEQAERRRAFLLQHLLPEFERLLDNMMYVYALGRRNFPLIVGHAGRGKPAAVRALGFWPEMAEEAAPILFRLKREGNRTTRQAAEQALALLSSRVGLADVSRLEKRVDLATAWMGGSPEEGPPQVSWEVAGRQVYIAISPGAVSIRARAGNRALATIPAAVRREPAFADIRECRERLARCYRYFRHRLEQAMVDELSFSGREVTVLAANPAARSLLARLVLTVDGSADLWGNGDVPSRVADAKEVRVAHPVGLHLLGSLETWQQRVAEEHASQPFKQVFREMYLVGDGELDSQECRRFAGHRLAARRAYALLRSRGYAVSGGTASRDWPGHGLTAHLRWAGPQEDAGWALGQPGDGGVVTGGAVWFTDQQGRVAALKAVPPTIFSESLRDADLLVSRAAAGELGFTSEETRRLRGALVRYLVRALGLTCVYVGEDCLHVLVEGKRATYRLHLGSGSVVLETNRRSLDLAALGSAFHAGGPEAELPPYGEGVDAATARIIGLVVTLSQDDRISDPGFVRQIADALG